jgi:predicted alpha-1,6-mannanase (GH76 family)
VRWADRAGESYEALVSRFWDQRRGLFRVATGWRGALRDPWHYWWQAHALDCVVLAGDHERARRLVAGILRRNGGRPENDYYDDMAWLAISLDRARAVLPVGDLVDTLYGELRGGWHEAGGIRWRRGDTYRNVPASAPTAVLAARRYLAGGDPADLAFARRITTWLGERLVSGDRVWDGVHAGQEAPNRDFYTYNHGTAAAAYALVGRAVEDPGPVRDGLALALAAVPPGGVLPAEGAGDGGLFKGIWARFSTEALPADGAGRLRDALVANAAAAWAARAPDGLFGASWERPGGAVSLSTHLSGVLLTQVVSAL